jgi:hypothetical protein
MKRCCSTLATLLLAAGAALAAPTNFLPTTSIRALLYSTNDLKALIVPTNAWTQFMASNDLASAAALSAVSNGWTDLEARYAATSQDVAVLQGQTSGWLTAESDPVWAGVSNTVTEQAGHGETAYGWGDHGTNGYLTAESDPLWSAVSNEVMSVVTGGVGSTYNDTWTNDLGAGAWIGRHDTNGYWRSGEAGDGSALTGVVASVTNEVDPVWAAVSNAITEQAAQGATAYAWGNHGTNGYISSPLADDLDAGGQHITNSAGIWQGIPGIAGIDLTALQLRRTSDGIGTVDWNDQALNSNIAGVTNRALSWFNRTLYDATGTNEVARWYDVFRASNAALSGEFTGDGSGLTNVTDSVARGWGDHGTNGYLTAESDPVWTNAVEQGFSMGGNIDLATHSITNITGLWFRPGFQGGSLQASPGVFELLDAAGVSVLSVEPTARYLSNTNGAQVLNFSSGVSFPLGGDGTGLTNTTDNAARSYTNAAQQGATAYAWGNHGTNGYLTAESDTLASVLARGNSADGGITNLSELRFNAVGAPKEIHSDRGLTVYAGDGVDINLSGNGFGIAGGWLNMNGTPVTNALYFGDGGGLTNITYTETDPTAVLANGTRPMSGNLDMGGYGVTNAVSQQSYWTPTVIASGTNVTIQSANGSLQALQVSHSPCVIYMAGDWPTNGVGRVTLEVICATNTVSFDTNTISFASAFTSMTNNSASVMLRRAWRDTIWRARQ